MFVRLLALPIRLSFSATWVAAQIGFRAGRLSVRGGRVVGRRLGWKRVAIFGSGVLVGLLLSVAPGRALRRGVARVVGSSTATEDGNLRDDVIFELAHAPRTWHLDQPEVQVNGGVVTLRGRVEHETACDALERTARSVDGVIDVVNDLDVVAPGG